MKIESGQVAVITGGASGIGLALANALAARGVRLVLADIEAPALKAAAGTLSAGTAVETFVCDVSDDAAVFALKDHAVKAFGRVDMAFNNAGVVLPFGPMWEHGLADWQWLMGVNLWGVIHGIRAFAPVMVARGAGHIVNTASMAGVGVVPYNGVYNAAKHAVVSMTETLAAELAERAPGVRASVLCPGLVPTRIRDAERNRPAALKGTGAPPNARPFIQPSADRPSLPADELARRTLIAIEQDRTYIFPNERSELFVEARVEALRRDLRELT